MFYGLDKKISLRTVDGKIKTFNIDGLFIAIGQVPSSDIFNNIVKLDDDNYIKGTSSCHTNRKGVFVAGDVRSKKIRQLVTATSDGCVAAIEAINYLNN